jgi:two-component system, chemotaxis family, chemotaxis protein CheY
MRILIVEDELVSREKLKKLLSEYGECDEAFDGEQAFEMFEKAHKKGKSYDLITMDIEMPGISGQETVKRIKEWEDAHKIKKSTNHVLILMITVMDDILNIMSSFREGCESYLIKPVTEHSLEARLKEMGLIKK